MSFFIRAIKWLLNLLKRKKLDRSIILSVERK